MSVLDMTLNNLMVRLWETWSTSSLLLLPGPLWPGLVASDRVLSIGQIELNSILMRNWMVLLKTKNSDYNTLHTETPLLHPSSYTLTLTNMAVCLLPVLAKHLFSREYQGRSLAWINRFKMELFWHLNCVLMLNRIVWNRNVYMYKNRCDIK